MRQTNIQGHIITCNVLAREETEYYFKLKQIFSLKYVSILVIIKKS